MQPADVGQGEPDHECDETSIQLPDGAMEREETQEEFVRFHDAYPLRGRPFGLAFVWANSYMDSRGATQLEISIDTATMVAEVLQQSGYEVRLRTNLRKRYIMDELTVELLTELKHTYDTVLVYFCGRGNGHAFYAQSHDELVTVEEIWQRLDEAGLRDKPRVFVMDLFELQSPFEEDFLSELDTLKHLVDGYREDLELMQEREVQPPDSLVEKVQKLEKQLAEKEAFRETLRHPPTAGLTARVAIMKLPLVAGIAKLRMRVKRLAYAIGFGVCEPEGLCRQHAAGMAAYSGLNDFLGADQFGWGFNEIGRTFANEYENSKGAKAAWQKRSHVREGDVVEITVDMVQGALRMEVPGKFKPAETALLHPQLVHPQERGVELRGAVALYGLEDEVEVEAVLVGEEDGGEVEEVRGPVWDAGRSGEGLVFGRRWVRREEGEGLPGHPHSLYVVHRQPLRMAPASYNQRREPVGQVALGLYDAPAAEGGGISLFAHLFLRRLRQAAASPDPALSLQQWLPAALQRDLDQYALGAFVRQHCGLEGRQAEEVQGGLEERGVGVHDLKLVMEKAALEDLGVQPRSALDAVFRGVLQARTEASTSVQALQVFWRHSMGSRQLLLNAPVLAWSRRHGAGFEVSEDGGTASKVGQTRGSCTVVASLASRMRGPRKYGAVLAGGGRHSWEFRIERLRSAQGEERGDPGSIRVGVVQAGAVLRGQYSVQVGQCEGGTTTTVRLDEAASAEDGAYEGLFIQILSGQGSGQSCRVFGYTGGDRTVDVVLEVAPDHTSRYAITRLEGFEMGDDPFSWAISSSTAGRSAAMHGEVAAATYKALPFQGAPGEVNRVTATGFEAADSFPRCLGEPLREGDVVACWLDVDSGVLAASLNGAPLGQAIRGVAGELLPVLSCAAATECRVTLANYRRWGPETGWAAQGAQTALAGEEEGALRASFRRFEVGGGVIQSSNMRGLMAEVGMVMTDAELEAVLDSVDVDGSGSIDLVPAPPPTLALREEPADGVMGGQVEFLGLMSDFKEKGQWALDQMHS